MLIFFGFLFLLNGFPSSVANDFGCKSPLKKPNGKNYVANSL